MVCDIKNFKFDIKNLKSRHELEKSGPDPSPSFQILWPGPEPEIRA